MRAAEPIPGERLNQGTQDQQPLKENRAKPDHLLKSHTVGKPFIYVKTGVKFRYLHTTGIHKVPMRWNRKTRSQMSVLQVIWTRRLLSWLVLQFGRLEHHETVYEMTYGLASSVLCWPVFTISWTAHTVHTRFLNVPELSSGFVIWDQTVSPRRQKEKSSYYFWEGRKRRAVTTQFIEIWTYCREVRLPSFLFTNIIITD